MIKYGTRVLIAILIHFLIKLFDETFEGKFLLFDLRGILFLIYFVLFTLVMWEVGDLIYKKTVNVFLKDYDIINQFIYLTIILSSYGLVVAFLMSLTYYLFDFLIFGFHHFGGIKYRFLDYDSYLGIFFGYISILLFNGQIYLFNHWREDRLKALQLQKENFQAKFETLKNQIDPHFLFNSLSVLTKLVYKNQDLAAEYINQLAKIYRYILEKKEELLVPLKDELEHVISYFFLIKIRFEEHIILNIEISDETKNYCYIPPNTLQMLVENAIKHNIFSDEAPIVISIREKYDYLVVSNTLKKRKKVDNALKSGLKNITNLYGLLNKEIIEVTEKDNEFIVTLPKLDLNLYESVNFRR